jgi:N-acetylmuramoyl-L-alanine amidase-like protein/VCBS repeat protein
MRFSRARYVTLCQQSLVTAAVLAVGLSAAGVKTLDIVPQPGSAGGTPGAGAGAAGASSREALSDGGATTHERSEVDSAPVTPKVREVSISTTPQRSSKSAPSARSVAPSPSPTPSASPSPSARTAPAARPGFVQTAPEKVQGYATIGLTWKHGVAYAEDQIVVKARTEDKGVWSKWMKVDYHDDHGPDAGSSEDASSRERPGTDALIVGDVDRVQVRAESSTGTLPPDLKLAIVDPGTGTMAKQAPAIDTTKLPSPQGKKDASGGQASGVTTLEGEGTSDVVALSAMTRPAKPVIYSRAQWGANEKMREQSPPSYGTVKTGFIHHTVNANNYTRAQVPALLRGIYAYHTQSRGWRDIGYNYLVDRFGRIWEGRWGGVDRAVVGAHTLGYNEVSFAMSAIGNFDIAKPPAAVVAAYTRLFAWKLAIYDIRANNPRINVKGKILHAINGHRDVGQTACPGRYLYTWLPYIRNQARNIQLAAQKGGVGSTTPPPKPTPPPAPVTPFTAPTQTPLAAKAQPAIAFPKSMNLAGSAYPDLVVKSRANGAIRVVPTGGQTGYGGVVQTAGSWRAMSLLAAVGDLTGDGKGDVLGRATRTKLTRVYRGDGAGHISVAGINASRRFSAANFVAGAGDWNGDGKADVLMRTKTSGSLYVVPGTGKGTFATPRLLSKSWAGYNSTAPAGDLTGDGRPDLVAMRNHVVYLVPGVAGGGIGAPVKKQTLTAKWTSLVGGARDLNGDGISDVVVYSKSTGGMAILTGKTNGTFGPTLGVFHGATGMLKVSSGQMAGSAAPDVVGTNAAGTRLYVLPANGLVNIGKSMATNLRVPGATQVLNVGDWNRDGKGDVITREGSGDTLTLRPGLGNGTFGTGVLMSKGWKSIARLSAVGDVTGDRFPDLVGKTASGAMTVFPGNGKSSFLAPVLAPAALRTYNQIGSAAWKPAGLPGSAFLSPDGAFVPFGGATGGALAGYSWVIGVGDVNGNGVADLVVRDTGGTLWLLPGTTTGYAERRFLASGYAGYSLGG